MPTKPKVKPLIVDFVVDRETKNTMRFQEVADNEDKPVIGTLYVQKDALAELGHPEILKVTVSV